MNSTILIVLSLLFAGMILGLIFKDKLRKYEKLLNSLLMLSIYLLLFFMGVSIGKNQELMKNLGNIGLKALLISTGAIIGSIIFAYLLFKKWKK